MSRMFPVAALALAAAWPGCRCEELPAGRPPLTSTFTDDFNRTALGPDWLATDAQAWRIEDGALVGRLAHNHPLWLLRKLPHDATIEFDCWSTSPDGDLKVEAWGDGKSFATDLYGAYTSTAYNFIFGGWHNTLSTIARMHEHGEDRHTRAAPRVEPGRHYHWTITRKGHLVDWKIDGQPFLTFDDAQPLEGDGHAYFAFQDWEAELHFDNLKITPL